MSKQMNSEILDALLKAAKAAEQAGDFRLADRTDELAQRVAQTPFQMVKNVAKPALTYIGNDQLISPGMTLVTNALDGAALGKGALDDTPSSMVGIGGGNYISALADPLNWGPDVALRLNKLRFMNMLRSQMISAGFTELTDDDVWRAFAKEKGQDGLESILRDVDKRFAQKFLGPDKIQLKDVNGFWNKFKVVAWDNRIVQWRRRWARHVVSTLSKGSFNRAKGRTKLQNEYIKKQTPDSSLSTKEFIEKNRRSLDTADKSGFDRSKIKSAKTKVSKAQFKSAIQTLSEKGQAKISGLISDMKSGKLHTPEWNRALKKSAAQVAEKNKAPMLKALKGANPSKAKSVIKGVAKKLGPAIAVAAFTELVKAYTEEDPKYAEYAKNPTENIPGGVPGSIVVYCLPFVGQALMAWDVGHAVGRYIANIPWVHDQLEEIGAGLESMFAEGYGVDAGEQAEVKNQLSLEGELDGGKFATQMRSEFNRLVRSGVAIDQAWSAVLRKMKASGASPESILYVRQTYNHLKSEFSKNRGFGRAIMPTVSSEQEAAALNDIKSNIDAMISAKSGDAAIREYLLRRMNTVADLKAKARLNQAALSYYSDRMNGKPATSVPVSTNSTAVKPALTKPTVTISGILSRGSRGPMVTAWQQFLFNQGFFSDYNIKTPDVFGPKTARGTQAFQSKYNLKVDGAVGPETLGKARQLGGKL